MLSFFASALVILPFALGVIAAPAPDRADTPVEVPSAVPAPVGFNITSLGVIGSGCPPGSAYYVLNPEKTAVTVTFSQFFAEAGPGIPISANRKNCAITLGVSIPSGFTFGVATVDYRGYYQLDRGVTASQHSIYYFQGAPSQAVAHSDLAGPVYGNDYTYRDSFDLVSTNLAPCGTSTILNMNSDVRVNNAANRQGSGYLATDSVDAKLSTTLNFQWQKC